MLRSGVLWRGLGFWVGLGWLGAALAQAPLETPVWQYSVRQGDTLLSLADRYMAAPAKWPKIQQLNHIVNPRRIPVGTVLKFPSDLLRAAPGQATLRAVLGQVLWRDETHDWQAASVGTLLQAGAQLQTRAQSYATLELANGTQVLLQDNGLLALDTLSVYAGGLMADTRLRLQQGQTEILDNPQRTEQQHLRVLTPSAQATVRGTVFRVAADAAGAREETLGGAVEMRARKAAVMVGAGLGTLVQQGQAPMAPRPLLGAPDLSAVAPVYEELPLRLPMPTMAGASAWWGQVASDAKFENLVASAQSDGRSLGFADLPNGTYRLRVRGVDALGLQGQDAVREFRVHARPFAPSLNQPSADSVVRVPRPELRWIANLESHQYRVQLASSADFATPTLASDTTALSITPDHDLAAGEYFWRVASVAADGDQGPWSAPVRFSFKPGPGQASIPPDALQLTPGLLVLDLPKPAPDQQYLVALAGSVSELAQAPVQASTDGHLRVPHAFQRTAFLSVRLAEMDAGLQGPAVIKQIELPSSNPPYWLLLIPLLALF